jgi:WD40 repeat protein
LVVTGSTDTVAIIWGFKDGAVIHKLQGHDDIIIRVDITFDSNIVITASRDGLINAWSSKYGYLFSTIAMQFILSDIILSTNGYSLIARLENSVYMPIIGISNGWLKESNIANNNSTSLASIKSNECKLITFLSCFYNETSFEKNVNFV